MPRTRKQVKKAIIESVEPTAAEAPDKATVEPLDEETVDMLISKLDCGNQDNQLFGYEEEEKLLTDIITRTIEGKESRSVVIYGRRGSGKTALLEYCLRQCNVSSGSSHCIIKLDGLIHNTDLLALNVISEDLGIRASSASQIGLHLKGSIKNSERCYFFILNEFDVFCRRQQTLLYTLFDALQYVSAMCLIGLTAKADCIELVEKRVRSRMSNTSIILTSPFTTENDYVKYAMDLMENKIDGNILKPLLRRQYKKSKTPRDLRRFLLNFLLNYEEGETRINQPFNGDRKMEQLTSLTNLELAVVCLISKKLRSSDKDIFRPYEIYELLDEIPKQINTSKELFFFVLHRLIDYGLISINSGQRSKSYVSDWTSLSLNVAEHQINGVIKKCKNTLPTNFSRLLEINK